MQGNKDETVSVVGAGFMGAQIGLECALHGYTVWFVDTTEAALEQARQSHAQELRTQREQRQITADETDAVLSRMHYSTDLQEGVSGADWVIEAVPELLEVKRRVFRQLDQVCPERTILATNSSSIRVSAIEDATQRPDRVLNLHFYGPGIPMVDLMRGTKTSDDTFNRASQFARAIGMTPLIARKESTGFVFNRVWRAVKKECLHVVDDGVASYQDVDRAWMIRMGTSVGPFGLMDMIGLDVVRDIELVYYAESGDESDAPPKLLLDKIEKGELGVKAGKGFYTYPNPEFRDSAWFGRGET